jgi:hypothetical protein
LEEPRYHIHLRRHNYFKPTVVCNSSIGRIRFTKAVTPWNMLGSNPDRNTENSN